MRTTRIATLLLLGGLIAAGSARSQEPPPYQGGEQAQQGDEQAPPDGGQPGEAAAPADPAVAGVEYFHAQLSPYGQWVERDGYGFVWVPRVHPGWRPYTTGHWIYTDQGWAWVADEPWGWAAFHYGRWFYDPEIGWAWVPGTVWAPAWVAWRHGGGYLGWAPLGPAVGFSAGVGLSFGGVVISAGFFTFVGERDILAPRVATVILPSTRNVTIVNNTTNITNYTVVNNRVVNNGVSVERIQQVTGRPVPRVQVAALASASSGGHPGAFYQPPVVARAARVSHAEFGKALPAQVAVEQKSRAFSRSATGGTRTSATGQGTAAAGAVTGRRQHGQAVSGQGTAGGQGQASGQGQPQASGQSTGRRTHVTKSTGTTGTTGTAGGQAQGESTSGAAGRPTNNPTGAQGEPSRHGHSAPPSGQSQAVQPPPHGQPQGQQAPPAEKRKTPPPKDKEKDKEHKPPPPPLV
jgi:Family of unknown function (DUF6600)